MKNRPIGTASAFTRFKTKIKMGKTSANPLRKTVYYAALTFYVPYRFLSNPTYRSFIRLKLFNKEALHQLSNYTAFDRYPELFEKCAQLMQEKKELSILSFGCSTGEEVLTLRSYFPEARITGVDINRYNIKKARAKITDAKVVFTDRVKEAEEKYGPYDMVFALAVLQRTENRREGNADSSEIYPFEKFNAQVCVLHRMLKPNGLFVIDYADYRFEDADVFDFYHPLQGDHAVVADRFQYDRLNKKMIQRHLNPRIFIKKPS